MFERDFSASEIVTLFSDTINYGILGAEVALSNVNLNAGNYYLSLSSSDTFYPTLYNSGSGPAYFAGGQVNPNSMDFSINGHQIAPSLGAAYADGH